MVSRRSARLPALARLRASAPALSAAAALLWVCCVALSALAAGRLQPLTLNDDQSVPCTALPSAADPVDADALAPALAKIQPTLDAIRGRLGAPGAAVIVVQGSRVVSFTASGEAAPGVPFARDTIVRIASNTKLFTSLLAYRLRDQGRLSMDDPVAKYVEGFQVKSPYNTTRPITLRALATHTSGLAREVPDCAMCATSQAAVLEALAAEDHAVLFPQFTRTAYSNLGLALLGRAAAVAAGVAPEEFEALAEREVLGVLGMTSSGFNYTDAVRAKMAHGVDSNGKPVPLPPGGFEWWAPCGTMFSTCDDMAKFMMHAMKHDAPADDATGMVVDGATFAEMQQTASIGGQPTGFGAIGAGTYELAHIGNGTDHAHWAVTKAGCLEGYRSDTFMVPELQLGIFAVATSTCDVHGDGDAITFPVADFLVPAVQTALERHEREAQAGGAWLPVPADPFTGAFADCGLTVNVENGTLVIRNWEAAYPMRLEFYQDLPGPPRQVTFRMHMLGPYLEQPGCFTFTTGGDNACPTSCMMRMGRSDKNFVTFTVKPGESKASSLASPGLATTCLR